jgi:LAO/AO transport system kinase
MSTEAPGHASALTTQIQSGDRRAVARLISLLESADAKQALEASNAAQKLPRAPHVIGITGPPGSGKSTLLDYLIHLFRGDNKKVAVIAVDPSSPFTGGALLGDRIRMDSHRNDANVFIRSMGSRGAAGGLSAAVEDSIRVLGGAGFDVVLIESVGAGQNEIEVAHIADTVCVLQVPGLGDDLQLMKMGILEIADVFIVHKADRPGAADLKTQLELAIGEAPGETNRHLRELGKAFSSSFKGEKWTPQVLLVSSYKREGGTELLGALKQHRKFLDTPELSDALTRARLSRALIERASRQFKLEAAEALKPGGVQHALIDEVLSGKLDVAQAAEKLKGRNS